MANFHRYRLKTLLQGICFILHDLFIKRTADLAEIERMITNLQEFWQRIG